MPKEEELNEQLEAYLSGNLSAEEAEEVRRRIAGEEEVAEAIALLRLERELAAVMVDDALEEKMREWEAEGAADSPAPAAAPPDSSPSGEDRYTGWLWLLLLLLIAMLVAWALWGGTPGSETPPSERPTTEENLSDRSTSPEKAPASEPAPAAPAREGIDPERPAAPTTAQPPVVAERPAVPERDNSSRQLALAAIAVADPFAGQTLRGTDAEPPMDEPPIITARRLIGEEEYTRAREVLEAIPVAQSGEYFNARQFLAYLDVLEGNYVAAIPKFSELIEMGYLDADKMRRYLALCYLATGEESRGLKLMRTVAESARDAEQKRAAQAFLERLADE